MIHIHFNFGFFELHQFGEMLDTLTESKPVIITFHKTKDAYVGKRKVSLSSIAASLNKCKALIVHQQEDVKTFLDDGVLAEKIKLIPLGQIVYPDEPVRLQGGRWGCMEAR